MNYCKNCMHYGLCYVSTGKDHPACYEFKDAKKYREIPCKIGDEVWTVRRCGKVTKVVSGIVGEMVFLDDMRLGIIVKCKTRGFWGKDIFATQEEAEAELMRRQLLNTEGGEDRERF